MKEILVALIVNDISRTFNEFLLLPNRTDTDCRPETVSLTTPISRTGPGSSTELWLMTPFTSAIMQAVSSADLCVSLARAGGLGFVYHNQAVADQANAVAQVKGAAVLREDYPDAVTNADGRLRVGAGVNTHDYRDRVPALVAAGADALCFDSSDGYSDWQAEALTWVKKHHPEVPVGGGNVVDGEAFTFLAEAGADFVKVGVGGGSICITRDQKGIGRGQATAVLDVAAARDAYQDRTGDYVPICCDGGLLRDYHLALALAMGSDFVMMGRYFARFDQAPGAKIHSAREGFVKEYWGEGSLRARNWQRYSGGGARELVFEEGVDGYVPYAGDLHEGVAATLAKVKATMVSCGAVTLRQFRDTARLTLVSEQSFQENHAAVAVRETAGTSN